MILPGKEILKQMLEDYPEGEKKMPVFFIGHGSPMNAIEENIFSETWKKLPNEIEKPEAILCISAHWLTKGTWVTAMNEPRTIHDFGGFPKELFEVQYPAPGDPKLAELIVNSFPENQVHLDHDWGLDHGTWSIVKHMYPEADIPVLQLSIDYHQPASYHYELAQYLKALRNRKVLIIGSGNMVHNLGKIAWNQMGEFNFGFDWAHEANDLFKTKIMEDRHGDLMNYQNLGSAVRLAVPTPDHYYPLIYSLGLKSKEDAISFFNDYAVAGSLTMTSVRIG